MPTNNKGYLERERERERQTDKHRGTEIEKVGTDA